MTRPVALILLAGLVAATASDALAAGRRLIPIQEDIRRLHQNDGPADRDPDVTGSIGPERNVTPTNPAGVPGFDGPPGFVGDSVGSYGPLPPGAAGNETW